MIRNGLEVIKNNTNCLKEYQLTPKESEGIGMTCGGNAMVFIEPITPLPRLMIIGAGHVSVAMVPLAKRLGFQVSVAEDRAEFTLKERFPEADEVSCVPIDKISEYIQTHTLDYVVLVNRQSSYDPDWLKAISQKQEAKYIGCIGSRMRAKTMLNNLRKLNLSEEFIQSIHTPIGLEINAETPEEIALSILAEITSIRRATPLS